MWVRTASVRSSVREGTPLSTTSRFPERTSSTCFGRVHGFVRDHLVSPTLHLAEVIGPGSKAHAHAREAREHTGGGHQVQPTQSKDEQNSSTRTFSSRNKSRCLNVYPYGQKSRKKRSAAKLIHCQKTFLLLVQSKESAQKQQNHLPSSSLRPRLAQLDGSRRGSPLRLPPAVTAEAHRVLCFRTSQG